MTDRPILFSAEMVRAILDGRKTQTRRKMKVQPWPDATVEVGPYHPHIVDCHGESHPGPATFGAVWSHQDIVNGADAGLRCPYGATGDLLWVRETWCLTRDTLDYETGGEASSYDWDKDLYGDPRSYLNGGPGVGDCAALHYPADGEDNTPSEMWPCIGLRGEILRKKEIRWRPSIHMPRWASRITLRITNVRVERVQDISEDDARAEGCEPVGWIDETDVGMSSCREGFSRLWERINGPGAWDENPWVWVLSFERVKP